jgi:hypothetical protein
MAARPALSLIDARALRAAKARFREIFPRGFADATYLDWERSYKWNAHRAWNATLPKKEWTNLIAAGNHDEVARRIGSFYARSHLNMLALFEWMALREALDDPRGAKLLSPALFELIHGAGPFGPRLERFTAVLDTVPQRQTRLAKWPVVTLFPFVAHPGRYLILKPRIAREASRKFKFDLLYESRPNARTHDAFLGFARAVGRELVRWKPRDMIDIQGFIWVTCSEEYEDWPWE